MARTTFVTLLALLGAAVLAFQLEGRAAMGVVAGALCGTSVSMLGASWQRFCFRTRPERAFQSVLEVFFFKLTFVLIGAIAFRYIEAAAARVDHRQFLLTFVVCALLIQTVAVSENMRLMRRPAGSTALAGSTVSAGSTAAAAPVVHAQIEPDSSIRPNSPIQKA